MTNNDTSLMRCDTAAAYLSLSSSRLSKLRIFGGGPKFIKVGHSVRYRREDLDTWLASLSRRSTSDSGENAGGGARAAA